MPIPSPVHEVTSALCTSYRWKEWAGYHAVCSFDTQHDREYFAFRHGAGLIDVSPLFKYEVVGPDAANFLSRVMTKDIAKLKIGQITYCCWCDDDGFIVDDGTVWRLSEDRFWVTAAEPSLSWLGRLVGGFKVKIQDVSTAYAALSLQGPNSRFTLCALLGNDISFLKYFRFIEIPFEGEMITVSRTGYTGDLGFELWISSPRAARLYQRILEVGKDFGAQACGLDAMDMTRIEAGFIMNGVEYYSANHCMTEARKSTPFELGLDWCVQLDRDKFVGQNALRREKITGSRRKMVGLEVDWLELEAAFSSQGLPPEVCSRAWRDGKPVCDQNMQFIGFATSGTWSPTLKKNLALAHVKPSYAEIGTKLKFEITVEYERKQISAVVSKLPFLDLPRKRS